MRRLPLVLLSSSLLVAAAACSKSAAKQEPGGTGGTGGTEPSGEKIAVPGSDTPPPMMRGAGPGTEGAGDKGAIGAAPGGGSTDDTFRLKPEEGQLAIEAPPAAKAGTEVTAKIVVTPAGPYKINKEFPIKLELEPPEGVTIEKPKLTAGGRDQTQGDAAAFDEKQLAFAVKVTPSQSGTHTINGTFKFAVCDKDTCLAKKEQISIAVAAN